MNLDWSLLDIVIQTNEPDYYSMAKRKRYVPSYVSRGHALDSNDLTSIILAWTNECLIDLTWCGNKSAAVFREDMAADLAQHITDAGWEMLEQKLNRPAVSGTEQDNGDEHAKKG